MRESLFPILIALFAVPSAVLSGCGADVVQGDDLEEVVSDAGAMELESKARGCDGRCSPSCPCTEGQGDCDSDRDCVSGLMCPADREGIERCEKRSGGGGGGGSVGGGGSGSTGGGGSGSTGGGGSGSSNLQVRLGGAWKGVCCSGGELEVSSGKCNWTESGRKLSTKDLRTGGATRLSCPENGQRPTDCSCTSSGEAMHGIAANGSVHVKNSLSKSDGAPLYPNSGHETCVDLVGGKLQSRWSNGSCPHWRLVNFY